MGTSTNRLFGARSKPNAKKTLRVYFYDLYSYVGYVPTVFDHHSHMYVWIQSLSGESFVATLSADLNVRCLV